MSRSKNQRKGSRHSHGHHTPYESCAHCLHRQHAATRAKARKIRDEPTPADTSPLEHEET